MNDEKFDRLERSVHWSSQQLELPRKRQIEALRLFTGYHYGEDAAEFKQPVNSIKLATGIYVRSLVPRCPRALMTTKIPVLKPMAKNHELAVNQIPEEIQLGKALRRLVLEAMFGMGIAHVGLHTAGEIYGVPYGTPFVDVITFGDYVVDMSARSFDKIQYEGHQYWLTLEEIEESDWFDKKALSKAREFGEQEESTIGEFGEEQAQSIAVGGGEMQSWKKRIWLRDIWLPQEGAVVTYLVKSKVQLQERELDCPGRGPYYKLGFDEVPGNLLPLPPVALWRDLHELGNSLYRKMGKGADKHKRVLGFHGDNEEEVLNFKAAQDGEGMRWSGAKPEVLEAGGVDSNTLAFWMHNRELFSYFAGNIDALGGLSPQAETATQDKLLTESASALLRDMAGTATDFYREIFRALAYYDWHDPVKVRMLEKPYPGGTLNVPWTPEMRQGDYDVYDLDIDVFSLVDDTPNLKLQRLGIISQQYVFPLMPAIEAQGGFLDTQEVLNTVSRYADLPEIKDWIKFANELPQKTEQQQGPQETTRRYERVSRPGATPRGKEDALQRVLMGDRLQKSEADVIGR